MASSQGKITAEQYQRYDNDNKRRAMEADDDSGYQVELFIYDLTKGLARTLSPAFLGKQIDGVWHTGVVAYGREYFFGSAGIESCKPAGTILGEPERIEPLGESQVPYQLFLEYIFGLGESAYRPGVYDLLKHNCNNFSDEIAQFLCGRGVPKAILQLPEEILNTPLGITLNEALKKVELRHANSRSINFGPLNNNTLGPARQIVRTSHDDPEFDELNDAIDRIRHNSVILEERRNSLNDKLSKKERKEKRKERRERKEKRRQDREDRGESRNKKKSKPPLPPTNSEVFNYPAPPVLLVSNCDDQAQLDAEVENTADTVNSLSLSETSPNPEEQEEGHINGDFEPVDDFWGDQEDDTSSSPQQEISDVIENTSTDQPIASTDQVDQPSQQVCAESPTPCDNNPDQFDNNYQSQTNSQTDMEGEAEAEQQQQPQQPPPAPAQDTDSEPVPEVEREPPILFKEDIDARRDFDELVGCCMHMLTPEEQKHMEELRSYVVEDDGAWALGESFGDLFARIFHDENIPDQARLHLLRIMAVAALKDDVILLLHQDRKDHTIMNYANKIEHLTPELQEAIALFFCNMFEHLSPSEWLLYISEWTPEGSMPISNIRVTTKVAVNALLHSNAKVSNYGTALMYNLGTKEVKTVVFDDVAPELAMAILQFLSNKTSEELLWRTITALCRFCYASSEVPSLIKMIGPEPNTFKGQSGRIDTVIEEVNAKLSRVRMF